MRLYISAARLFPALYFPKCTMICWSWMYSLSLEKYNMLHSHGKKSPGPSLEMLVSGSMAPINSFHSQLWGFKMGEDWKGDWPNFLKMVFIYKFIWNLPLPLPFVIISVLKYSGFQKVPNVCWQLSEIHNTYFKYTYLASPENNLDLEFQCFHNDF